MVTAAAQTTGWVLVGFHNTQALAGSRLVMIAVTEAGPVLEEHLADPPRHSARASCEMASLIEATQTNGTTTSRFALPLNPGDASAPVLVPGQQTWMWLAWSREDNFEHHSVWREGVWVSL